MTPNESVFVQQWCEQTTAAITRIQDDVTEIKILQEAQKGRIKALEKVERFARRAAWACVTAVGAMVVEYFKNHYGR